MRHENHRLILIELAEILHDVAFVLSIKRIGGLIKKDDVRILLDRPCYQYPLLLALAQTYAVLSD